MNFQPAAVILLREAFEGREAGKKYTWFVEKQEGIFDALESVSAERASARPSPECSSIAAHAYHMLFALQSTNAYLGRPKPDGDWESSWQRQTVTSEEWMTLGVQIRDEYRFFLNWLETNADWSSDEAVVGGLAQLPHMAFHLGAIRQIIKIV